MELVPCTCQPDQRQLAIVTGVFMVQPETWQIEFVTANIGKLVCFFCGGEVSHEEAGSNYDHVTATSTTERLRELGVI